MQLTLEEELRLPTTDLRSHGWYHGPIGRQIAESLLTDDGQFLVRDCLSQANDYVLSCQHSGAKLHFIINRMFIMPNTLYERVQFQLEDDLFDTIADLVTFYVGNKQPITQRSGAQICRPVIRKICLGLGADAPPPPKPDRNYCNAHNTAQRRTLRKEYSKYTFKIPDPTLGKLRFDSVEFCNGDGINEGEVRKVQIQLRESGARSIGRGLTLIDLRILKLDSADYGNGNDTDLGCGAVSGLEILTLPQGETLRHALMERASYLRLLVIATILLAEDELQLAVLTKWIQVSSEIKSALGNLFGFQCIMSALMSSCVAGRKSLWLKLRQKNTELALLFETKLRQEVSSLTDKCDNIAPNTCIPNIYLYTNLIVQLTEKVERIQFEKCSPDFGLATILCHLENMRSTVDATDRFRKNAILVIKSSSSTDKDYPFFETEYIISIFNTISYQQIEWAAKRNVPTEVLDNLRKICDHP